MGPQLDAAAAACAVAAQAWWQRWRRCQRRSTTQRPRTARQRSASRHCRCGPTHAHVHAGCPSLPPAARHGWLVVVVKSIGTSSTAHKQAWGKTRRAAPWRWTRPNPTVDPSPAAVRVRACAVCMQARLAECDKEVRSMQAEKDRTAKRMEAMEADLRKAETKWVRVRPKPKDAERRR